MWLLFIGVVLVPLVIIVIGGALMENLFKKNKPFLGVVVMIITVALCVAIVFFAYQCAMSPVEPSVMLYPTQVGFFSILTI